MAETMTANEFLDLVSRSGILRPEVVDTYRPNADDSIASRMLNDGVLTPFHVKQLQGGRFRGFFIANKYKLLGFIRKGGMGRVLLCEHLSLQRVVAVKLMDPSLEAVPGAAERFIREARAAAAVDHPSIARIYDVDRCSYGMYMVMEFIDGATLHDLVVQSKSLLSFERVAHYISQAAMGLQQAHLAGLIHRDIKPSNYMIDRSGNVKLLDLGLARFFDSSRNDELTSTFNPNAVLGTANYIAPEQVSDSASADIRADIYSLGCTLYFLLVRRHPVAEGTTMQKLIWHQTKEPKPVENYRNDVPHEFIEVMKKMIRKNPDERYQTPIEIVQALKPFVPEQTPVPSADELQGPRVSGIRLGLSGTSSVRLNAERSGTNGNQEGTSERPRTDQNGSFIRGESAMKSPSSQSNALNKPSLPDSNATSVLDPSGLVPISENVVGHLVTGLRKQIDRRAIWFGVAAVLLLVVAASLVAPYIEFRRVPKNQSPFAKNARTDEEISNLHLSRESPEPSNVTNVSKTKPESVENAAAQLRGGGSTFIKPMLDHWTTLYAKEKGIAVEYTGAGSSKGIEGVLSQFLDFGCTDAPLTDKQLLDAKVPVLHIPLVLGAVVPTYNLSDAKGQQPSLRFTGPVLGKIFLGTIKKWNDPAIAVSNPGITLPNLDIKVITRKDGSGTTNVWTSYLSKVSSAWKEQIGAANSIKWPTGISAEKNSGVADLISRTNGSIGYVELSSALANGLSHAQVQNREGQFIGATVESIRLAAMGFDTSIPDDLRFSLVDAPGRGSYPIVGATWAIVFVEQPRARGTQLKEFMRWMITDGQNHVESLHYGRLPPPLVEKSEAALSRIK